MGLLSFEKSEFFIVQGCEIDENLLELADVVLPTHSNLEKKVLLLTLKDKFKPYLRLKKVKVRVSLISKFFVIGRKKWA